MKWVNGMMVSQIDSIEGENGFIKNEAIAFKEGGVWANGVLFHYIEIGSGPLALCLHGFPDSPWTYRHLMPELAQAGYRVVAPYMRGFYPTTIPENGDLSLAARVGDVNALHEVLKGDGNAIVIAHDWGAIAAYGALAAEPDRWKKAVIGSIPHMQVFREISLSYPQIKRSFYFWFFQMALAEKVVALNDLAFIEELWRDWSPDFDPATELSYAKNCLRRPENLRAVIGYYRSYFDPVTFGTKLWQEEQLSLWGMPIKQPTLYIHGANDGCVALDESRVQAVKKYLGTGSRAEFLSDAGHFFWVEQPEKVNKLTLEFLGVP